MVTTALVEAERRANFVSLITPYLEIDVNRGEKVILANKICTGEPQIYYFLIMDRAFWRRAVR